MSPLQEQKMNSTLSINNQYDFEILETRFELACNSLVHRSFCEFISNSDSETEVYNKISKHPIINALTYFIETYEGFVGDIIYYIKTFSDIDLNDRTKDFDKIDCMISSALIVLSTVNIEHLNEVIDDVMNSNNVFWAKKIVQKLIK